MEIAKWRARQQRLETLGVEAEHPTTPLLLGQDRAAHARRAETEVTLILWVQLGGPPRPTTGLVDSTSTSCYWTTLQGTVCTESPIPLWASTNVTTPVTSMLKVSSSTKTQTSTGGGLRFGESKYPEMFPSSLKKHILQPICAPACSGRDTRATQ